MYMDEFRLGHGAQSRGRGRERETEGGRERKVATVAMLEVVGDRTSKEGGYIAEGRGRRR